MILRDSFERKFGNGLTARGASNPWRPLGSLPHRAHPEIFRPFLARNFPRGRGASNLWGSWGRVPAWVSRADFFSRSKTFEYFSRNQTFQTHATRGRGGSVNDHKDLGDVSACGRRGTSATALFIFCEQDRAPGGGSNLYDLSIRDRWGRNAHFSAKLRKIFFREAPSRSPVPDSTPVLGTRARQSREKIAAKFRVGGVGRSRMT